MRGDALRGRDDFGGLDPVGLVQGAPEDERIEQLHKFTAWRESIMRNDNARPMRNT